MQKILLSLEDDGVLSSRRKRYALPGPVNRPLQRQIVFVTLREHLSQVSALNHEHNHIANALENECIRNGLQLAIIEIDFFNPQESRIAATNLRDSDETLGFIFDAWWYLIEGYRTSCLDVLERLSKFKKPVAILDEFGSFELPTHMTLSPLLQVYRIEGKRAGERMGRYLVSLGHRSAVFISILHFGGFSRDRLLGAEHGFSSAGNGDNVHLCANSVEVLLPYVLTASGLDADVIRTLISAGLTPSQSADQLRRWQDFRKNTKAPYIGYPRLNSILKKNLKDLVILTRSKTDDLFLDKTIAGAINAVGDRSIDALANPLFEEALHFKDATAWICSTDDIAARALAFLQKKNIRVPDDISVTGFDNTPVKSLEKRLTTFDFNATGFIHHMLNFILRPPRPRGPHRHSTIEVEGIIMQRGTTGPAKLPPYPKK
jgi:DNA-binding LacI/PurR family transcriptional regulator